MRAFLIFPIVLMAGNSLGAIPETQLPAVLHVALPLEYQVYQRNASGTGSVVVAGALSTPSPRAWSLEARLLNSRAGDLVMDWHRLATIPAGATEFRAALQARAGGWYRLEVRLQNERTTLAENAVAHLGIGEVFVVAGQSNSANHGEEKQTLGRGLAAAFHGGRWRLAEDPQPGASGNGGSFIPPFCDAMVERFHVPIGIIAAGVGATSVREWLPSGVRFPNPPTLTNHVRRLATGEWESKGALFENLVARMKQVGPHGFRAVLWHQGESDANQADTTRTLRGDLYQKYLEQIIRESRRSVGWELPWFVAQASYHSPEDVGSTDIRTAQQALWQAGIALEGPDTDALVGALRDSGGRGVHFSGNGLRQHGAVWAQKVSAWMEKR
jgi:hypothetical protein